MNKSESEIAELFFDAVKFNQKKYRCLVYDEGSRFSRKKVSLKDICSSEGVDYLV